MIKSENGRIDMKGEVNVLCADLGCAIQALRGNIAKVTGDLELANSTVQKVCNDGMEASLDDLHDVEE